MSQILNFLDIETTGTSYNSDEIIEIGVVKVVDEKIVDTYSTLIKSSRSIDPYATMIHGITNSMLQDSPTFADISKELYDFLDDGIFVAHNARFDYSFIKRSFGNINVNFSKPYACTVKLSRMLYPHHRRHGLSEIIDRFGIQITDRHRALGDTQAMVEFFFKAKNEKDPQLFEAAFKRSLQYSAIPAKLVKFDFKNTPNTPGVYIFKNEDGIPIYVGKSIHLQERIKQHFYGSTRFSKEMDIAREVADIEIIETVGELGALLREVLLVKKLKPKYNSVYIKSYPFLLQKNINESGYFVPETKLIGNDGLDFEKTLGIFQSKRDITNFLNYVQKQNALCSHLLTNKSGVCFGYHIKTCFGACIGEENPESYNEKFLQAFEDYSLKKWDLGDEFVFKETNLVDQEEFKIKDWVFIESNKDFKNEIEGFDYDIYRILKKFI